MGRFLIIIGVLVSFAPALLFAQPVYTVRVEAGAYARHSVPVAFDLPEGRPGAGYRLVDAAGRSVPLQQGAEGRAWFVLDRLAAGAAQVYTLFPVEAESEAPAVVAQEEDGRVALRVDDHPVLHYQAAPSVLPRPDIDLVYRRGGYIHPVVTPTGRIITDDYPPNHVHHHGIWAAWTNTVFDGRTPDFWNMGAETGTVEPVALDAVWSGAVFGGFRARHRYVDLTAESPVAVLAETWDVSLYNVQGAERPYWIFDLEQRQENLTTQALRLPEYRYGGVGFRGRREWDGAENTFFLTSEGRDRSDGHATRARWCHIGGYVDGVLTGIAILGHPDNFRAPQPMRIHPTEPFFNYAPSQAGDWAIEPGEPYVGRYRFVVYDGPPEPDMLDRLWNDYAYPPQVVVTPK